MRLEQRLDLRLCPGIFTVVVPEALIAVIIWIAPNEFPALPDGTHGFPIQLHSPNGRVIGAAPVEIQPSVLVLEEIRVPKIKSTFYFLVYFLLPPRE